MGIRLKPAKLAHLMAIAGNALYNLDIAIWELNGNQQQHAPIWQQSRKNNLARFDVEGLTRRKAIGCFNRPIVRLPFTHGWSKGLNQ